MRSWRIGRKALLASAKMMNDGSMYLPYLESSRYSQVCLFFASHKYFRTLIQHTKMFYVNSLGDIMQFMTNSYLPSTPHKVGLNTRERFAFAYFHEPSFQAVIPPVAKLYDGQPPDETIHYGTHFTNMFMRNYPDRVTTERMLREDRLKLLDLPELRTQ